MSNICLIDLKEHGLDFEQYNQLAKRVVQYSLNNDLAVFFNSYEYCNELINEVGMNSFFLMSDSFIYKHADFLDLSELFLDNDIEKFRKEFHNRFSFFTEIIDILVDHKIFNFDIYLDITNCNSLKDFDVIKTNQNNLLDDLFDSIIRYCLWFSDFEN